MAKISSGHTNYGGGEGWNKVIACLHGENVRVNVNKTLDVFHNLRSFNKTDIKLRMLLKQVITSLHLFANFNIVQYHSVFWTIFSSVIKFQDSQHCFSNPWATTPTLIFFYVTTSAWGWNEVHMWEVSLRCLTFTSLLFFPACDHIRNIVSFIPN